MVCVGGCAYVVWIECVFVCVYVFREGLCGICGVCVYVFELLQCSTGAGPVRFLVLFGFKL